MAVHRLQNANHVIALASDGTIREQGPPQSVLSMNGYVHSLFKAGHEDKEISRGEASVPESHTNPSVAQEAQGNGGEEQRSVAVYLYYFKAIGWLNSLIFICGAVSFAVFFKISGTRSRNTLVQVSY